MPDLPAKSTEHVFKKNQIINLRFNRVWREKLEGLSGVFRPVILKIQQAVFGVYTKILELERRHKGLPTTELEDKDKRQKYIWEAGELVKQGNFDEAEQRFIKVIKWDRKNIAAYEGLADLYWHKKEYGLAKDTLEYVLKIDRTDPEVYWQLGSLAQEQDLMEEAVVCLSKAYEIAPNNPKYIDSLLEVSIALRKKDLAWKLVARLKVVNSENKKLLEFEERIRAA